MEALEGDRRNPLPRTTRANCAGVLCSGRAKRGTRVLIRNIAARREPHAYGSKQEESPQAATNTGLGVLAIGIVLIRLR
jgi:hypothetical protein